MRWQLRENLVAFEEGGRICWQLHMFEKHLLYLEHLSAIQFSTSKTNFGY